MFKITMTELTCTINRDLMAVKSPAALTLSLQSVYVERNVVETLTIMEMVG